MYKYPLSEGDLDCSRKTPSLPAFLPRPLPLTKAIHYFKFLSIFSNRYTRDAIQYQTLKKPIMKNTFLLLLCTTFLHVSGQNFKLSSGHSNQAKYTVNNYEHVVDSNKPSRSSISPVHPPDESNRLSSLVSLTAIQVRTASSVHGVKVMLH